MGGPVLGDVGLEGALVQAVQVLLDAVHQDLVVLLGHVLGMRMRRRLMLSHFMQLWFKKEYHYGIPQMVAHCSSLNFQGKKYSTMVEQKYLRNSNPALGKKMKLEAVHLISQERGFSLSPKGGNMPRTYIYVGKGGGFLNSFFGNPGHARRRIKTERFFLFQGKEKGL